jgi:tetratricopeptide (TPR) repeat protein
MEEQGELLESVTSYESRGVAALAARDWAGAAAAFRKGLDLQPGDPALRHRLASALYSAGDEAGAIRELEEVVRQSADFAKARVTLGTFFNVRGRYPEAIAQFSAASRSDPVLVEAQLGMAEALRMSGSPEASLPHYARATQLDPTIVEGWLGGAAALITLRRTEEARDWLAAAGRVHPNHAKLAELGSSLKP